MQLFKCIYSECLFWMLSKAVSVSGGKVRLRVVGLHEFGLLDQHRLQRLATQIELRIDGAELAVDRAPTHQRLTKAIGEAVEHLFIVGLALLGSLLLSFHNIMVPMVCVENEICRFTNDLSSDYHNFGINLANQK